MIQGNLPDGAVLVMGTAGWISILVCSCALVTWSQNQQISTWSFHAFLYSVLQSAPLLGTYILVFAICSQWLSRQPLKVFCLIQFLIPWRAMQNELPTKWKDLVVVCLILILITIAGECARYLLTPSQHPHNVQGSIIGLVLGLCISACAFIVFIFPCQAQFSPKASFERFINLINTTGDEPMTQFWTATAGVLAAQNDHRPNWQFIALSVVPVFLLSSTSEIRNKNNDRIDPVAQTLFDFAVVVSLPQLPARATLEALYRHFFAQRYALPFAFIGPLGAIALHPAKNKSAAELPVDESNRQEML
jgi:hypothetical protein